MPNRRRAPLRVRLSTVAMVGALLVVAAGCGTRVPREEALAVLGGQPAGAGRTGHPVSGGSQVAGATGAAPGGGPQVGGPLDAADAVDTGVEGAEPSRTGPVGGDGGGDRVGPAKSPIRVGMDGIWTGIVGQSLVAGRDAYAAWAKSVNDRGGVNGHPIELLISDNGGDAARAISNIKDFVENQDVIALVNLFPPSGSDGPIAEYAEKHGVPVVGGFAVDDVWQESPVLFSAVTSNSWRNFAYAAAMSEEGFKNVGVVYCTELEGCKASADGFVAGAKKLGMNVAYEGSFSLAQPDFTAQCLQAQGKAEAIFIAGDAASGNRMSQSCARQGYEPTFVVPFPSDNVVAELDGALGAVSAFPWFLTSGTPALQEYGDALNRYASAVSATSSVGWVNGKLLEKALANVPDSPTSQDIFTGLWALQGETLDGLSPPLSFSQGQPGAENPCWFVVKLSDGKWTSPSGLEPSCAPSR